MFFPSSRWLIFNGGKTWERPKREKKGKNWLFGSQVLESFRKNKRFRLKISMNNQFWSTCNIFKQLQADSSNCKIKQQLVIWNQCDILFIQCYNLQCSSPKVEIFSEFWNFVCSGNFRLIYRPPLRDSLDPFGLVWLEVLR